MRMAQGEYQNRIHFAWIVWAPATPAPDSEMVSSIIVASDMPSSVPPNSCGLANMIVMIGSNARTIGAYMQMPRKPALANSRWRSPAYSDFLSNNQSICRADKISLSSSSPVFLCPILIRKQLADLLYRFPDFDLSSR